MQLKQATRGAEEPRSTSPGIHSGRWIPRHLQSGTRLLDPFADQPPIHRDRRAKPQKHPHLHHPPVYPAVHLQPGAPDAHLIRDHPAKQTHFETRQAQDIRFESAHHGPPRVVSGHGCDAEILEHNAEEDGEGIVDEELRPDCAVVDGRGGAIDEPFAHQIAQDAAGAAMGDPDGDRGPHRTAATHGVMVVRLILALSLRLGGRLGINWWRLGTTLFLGARVGLARIMATRSSLAGMRWSTVAEVQEE